MLSMCGCGFCLYVSFCIICKLFCSDARISLKILPRITQIWLKRLRILKIFKRDECVAEILHFTDHNF